MSIKIISKNKKSYHDYEILEKYEAGIVLTGAEIKAIRAGKVSLKGAYAKILGGDAKRPNEELFVVNLHISIEKDPERTRKLLMHKQEIRKLIGKTQIKGLALVPTQIYLKKGKAKIELALARGKKIYDKRETIKKRDLERESKKG